MRKPKKFKYDHAEGYCFPTWLTLLDTDKRRFEGVLKMRRGKKEALLQLQADVKAVLARLLITYPGSRAERDYKDLNTQINNLLAKMQKG